MSDKKTEKSYEDALAELQNILQQIESGDIGIDRVSEEVKKASQLLKFCQEKLRNLETELKNHFEPEK